MKRRLIDPALARDTDAALEFVSDILEASSEYSIIGADLTGRIQLWNAGAKRFYGYEPEETVGKADLTLLFPPEDIQSGKPLEIMATALKAGLWKGTASRIRKSGQRFTARAALTLRRDLSGNPAGFLLVSSDISDEIPEERFRLFVEGSPTGMIVVSPEGKILLVNSQIEKLFGYSREELAGESIELLVPDRFRGEHPGHRRAFGKAPSPRPMGAGRDLYALRKDRTEFPVEIGLNPINTAEGVLVLATIIDISERKTYEESRRYERVLEEASRAKSEFLANMSHELRTPLNGIIGFSEFLVDGKAGPLAPKQAEYLNDILLSGRHLLQLINDVLDLAKVEAGKMELYPETFSIDKAIAEVHSVISHFARKKGITMKINVSAEADTVTLDQPKFKQILYNLLSNAIKFTGEKGSVEIHVDCPDRQRVSLRVTDTGIGMKKEDMGRLFAPFEQLDPGVARKHGGTGLGLALTKKLVELHNGEIKVESQPGKGSRFTVTLPRTVQKAKA